MSRRSPGPSREVPDVATRLLFLLLTLGCAGGTPAAAWSRPSPHRTRPVQEAPQPSPVSGRWEGSVGGSTAALDRALRSSRAGGHHHQAAQEHHQHRQRGDCGLEHLEACLRVLQGVTQSDRMAFPASREDLDAVCSQLHEGVTCVDKYMQRCFNDQQKQIVESVVAGARQIMNDLCVDTQMQAEFLEHAPCFREVGTSPLKCAPYYQRVVQAGRSAGNESSQNVDVQAGLRQYCCALTEFLRCKSRLVELECTSEASKFLQLNTEKMSGALIHQHCSMFTFDSTCQSAHSSASTVGGQLLLLLLALIPRFAYHR